MDPCINASYIEKPGRTPKLTVTHGTEKGATVRFPCHTIHGGTHIIENVVYHAKVPLEFALEALVVFFEADGKHMILVFRVERSPSVEIESPMVYHKFAVRSQLKKSDSQELLTFPLIEWSDGEPQRITILYDGVETVVGAISQQYSPYPAASMCSKDDEVINRYTFVIRRESAKSDVVHVMYLIDMFPSNNQIILITANADMSAQLGMMHHTIFRCAGTISCYSPEYHYATRAYIDRSGVAYWPALHIRGNYIEPHFVRIPTEIVKSYPVPGNLSQYILSAVTLPGEILMGSNRAVDSEQMMLSIDCRNGASAIRAYPVMYSEFTKRLIRTWSYCHAGFIHHVPKDATVVRTRLFCGVYEIEWVRETLSGMSTGSKRLTYNNIIHISRDDANSYFRYVPQDIVNMLNVLLAGERGWS